MAVLALFACIEVLLLALLQLVSRLDHPNQQGNSASCALVSGAVPQHRVRIYSSADMCYTAVMKKGADGFKVGWCRVPDFAQYE